MSTPDEECVIVDIDAIQLTNPLFKKHVPIDPLPAIKKMKRKKVKRIEPIEITDSDDDAGSKAATSRQARDMPINYFASTSSASKTISSSSSTSKSRSRSASIAPEYDSTAKNTTNNDEQIPVQLLATLNACPVCCKPWSKSSASRSTHVTQCAKKEFWEMATVRKVVDRTIRDMVAAKEAARQEAAKSQTLFRDVIGGRQQNGRIKVAKQFDMDVVGLDEDGALTLTQGGSVTEAFSTSQVSKELEREKRKARQNQTSTISKVTRLGKAVSVLEQSAASDSGSDHVDKAALKKFGHIRPYSETRFQLAETAERMLSMTPQTATTSEPDELDQQHMVPSKLARRLARSLSGSSSGSSSRSLPSVAAAQARARTGNHNLWSLSAGTKDQAGSIVDRPLSSEFSTLTSHFASSKSSSISAIQTKKASLDPQTSEQDSIHPTEKPKLKAKAKTKAKASEPASEATSSKAASTSKTTSTSKAVSIQPDATATSTAPDKPDWSSWKVPQLREEMAKYGYKPARTRAACIKVLDQVCHAMHPSLSPLASEATASESDLSDASTSSSTGSSKRAKRASGTKKVPRMSIGSAGEFMEEEDEDVDKDEAPQIKGSKRAINSQLAHEQFCEKMRRAVLKDKAMYSKIIRYEPITFESMSALADINGIPATSVGVRRFLDEEGIAFFQETSVRAWSKPTKRKTKKAA